MATTALLIACGVDPEQADETPSERDPARGSEIVGGRIADAAEAPFAVKLSIKKGDAWFRCGGTIVDHQSVVTAAHCFKTEGGQMVDAGDVRVYAYTGRFGTVKQRHDPRSVHVHPDYDPDVVGINDIAVVRLDTSFDFDGSIQPIDIDWTGQVAAEANATFADPYFGPPTGGVDSRVWGWGRTEDGELSAALRVADVVLWGDGRTAGHLLSCGREDRFENIVVGPHDDAMVPGEGFNSGDSGGPVTADGLLVGVVAYSCKGSSGMPRGPRVATSVAGYAEWLADLGIPAEPPSSSAAPSGSEPPVAPPSVPGSCRDTANVRSAGGEGCSTPERWRCVAHELWDVAASQVCRDGVWHTFVLNPADCARCCGDYSAACHL